jgi:AcrR family transcriptional regulator
MPTEGPYHHGDLRRAVLDAALVAIAEVGPSAVSLRDLARRAGVSHAAPAHHFGDKAGVLTAVAAEGYRLLADALSAAHQRTGDFAEVGVAYVRFAIDHKAHFEVMFRPELYHADTPAVRTAQDRAGQMLYGGVASLPEGQPGPDPILAGAAAWSLVHGFATLWLNGALPPRLREDPDDAARSVARLLFRGP